MRSDALPISFSRPLIPKVNDDSKDQTRRLVKPGPGQAWLTSKTISEVRRFEDRGDGWWSMQVGEPNRIVHCGVEMDGGHIGSVRCPYGRVGSLLWVREDHRFLEREGNRVLVHYEADGAERWATLTDDEAEKLTARSSPLTRPQPGRFLYRSCARTLLEVRSIRLEHLQDISEEDAKAEGCSGFDPEPRDQGGTVYAWKGRSSAPDPRAHFATLWDSLNGEKPGAAWADSPWVWCISFKRAEVRS